MKTKINFKHLILSILIALVSVFIGMFILFLISIAVPRSWRSSDTLRDIWNSIILALPISLAIFITLKWSIKKNIPPSSRNSYKITYIFLSLCFLLMFGYVINNRIESKRGFLYSVIVYKGDSLELRQRFDSLGKLSAEWTTRGFDKYGLKGVLKHGFTKWYFPDGKLEAFLEYKDENKDGIWEDYYPNGKIQSKGFYKNDIKDSLWLYYYEDGSLKKRQNWLNGHKFKDQYEYDSTTHKLKNYSFYSLFGDLLYERQYEQGKLVREEGQNLYVVKNKDTVTVGNEFGTVSYVAFLSELYYTLKITIKNSKGKIVYDTLVNNTGLSEFVDAKEFIYSIHPKTIDKLLYTEIISWDDTVNHRIGRDTCSFHIVVKNKTH